MDEIKNTKKYNFIYSKLVESENDLVGLVAYGMYKQHKISFINDFKEKYKREPNDSECEVFFLTSTTTDQLQKYRNQAEILVSEIVSNTTLEEIQNFESDMLSNYEEKIENAVKRNVPSNTKSLIIGICGSLIGAIILTVMTLFFYFWGNTIDKDRMKDVQEIIKNNNIPNPQNGQPLIPDSLKIK
ncbi:MAG TPA: hypothetical protein DEQ30_15510 [Porphyromonadaceae bacterium]|nr:hypothetical protein [Porphyromonadaceae bacterium]